jgi:GT2 family glycosyltransferase
MITYIVAPICDVYIARFLYTLHKFSEPGTFKVICIDQAKDGFSRPVMEYVRPLINLYMHPTQRQYGYAKAMNLGIVQALHQKSDYICLANDDIEIMDARWIQGIWDTFALNPERIMGVSPMNPRIPGWGYNVKYNPEPLPYKTEYDKKEYDYLLEGDFTNNQTPLPDSFPKQIKGSIVDGAIFIMPYFKREFFEEIGLLDERFFPGSGEDMDMMARAYQKNYRIVSTSLSWVWHHLSKSKDLFASGELEDPYYKPKDHPYWNNMGEIWPEGHDPWGKIDGKLLPRVPEVHVDPL